MIELVYKFDENSYCVSSKGKSIAKVRFKLFLDHKHINIYIYMDTNPNHFTLLALRVWGKYALV